MSESVGESVGEKRKEMMGSPNAHAVREFCSLRGKDEPVHKSVRESVLQNTNYRLPPEKTLKVDEKSAFGQQIMERIKSDWHVNEQAWRKELQSQENFTQVRSVRNKNGNYDYFDKQTARIVSSQEYEARYGLFLRSRTRDGASHQGNSNSGNGCSSISNGDGCGSSSSSINENGGSTISCNENGGGSSSSNGDGGSTISCNENGGSSSSSSSNGDGSSSSSTAFASTPVCADVNSTNGSCDSISSDSSSDRSGSNDSEGSNGSNISSLSNTGQVSVEKTPPPTPSSTPIDAAADKENTTLASLGAPAPPNSSKRSGTPVPTPPSASGSKDLNNEARQSTKPHTPRSALFTVQDPSQDALHENAGDPPPVKANVGAVRPSTPCGVM